MHSVVHIDDYFEFSSTVLSFQCRRFDFVNKPATIQTYFFVGSIRIHAVVYSSRCNRAQKKIATELFKRVCMIRNRAHRALRGERFHARAKILRCSSRLVPY